jgi:transcription antitermination factor NusG
MSGLWFALQVAPKMENKVALALEAKGIEHLVPRHKVKRAWSDRIKMLELPLFPGYVFCRLVDGANTLAVSTYGVVRIVSFGGKPCPLASDEIVSLQKLSSTSANVRPCPFQSLGSKVRIANGPLAGVVGIISGSKKRQLVVSIEMLMRSVAVEIDPDYISPLAA